MKWLRRALWVGGIALVLTLALSRIQRRTGFPTPEACLDAYREACLQGNVEQYWDCLVEPYRFEQQRLQPNAQELAASLRREMREVKSWVQSTARAAGDGQREIDVDQACREGNRRLHVRLMQDAGGWRIAGIDPPQRVPAAIPYGTHISKVPDNADAAEP